MAERQPGDDERAQRPRTDRRSPEGSHSKAAGKKPYVKADGPRKPYPQRDGDAKPYAKRDGERKPYPKRDGERKPYAPRDGERKPYPKRDGERKPYPKRDGERKPYAARDGERKPYAPRDGERKPYAPRDGERKPYPKRDGERKPYAARDGERKPYAARDGERKPYAARDGERKPYAKRDGDARPYGRRDGDAPRPYGRPDGGKKPYGRSGGSPRPTRGGADRPDRAMRPGEIRPVRERHEEPFIPEEVTAKDLHPSARNELKTLSKENADQVARHLAMASQLIDEDPELAHQHALAASRRAGRIAVVRESLAITAYATGDYALALRELRTYRRISGSEDQIALMVDSERGVGRPDRALEVGRAVDRAALPVPVRVELAIAMSGARLDLGEPERALSELDIPEFDPDRAFDWSPALFAARATVLEELGREDEANEWYRRAVIAAEALDEASGIGDTETIIVEEVFEEHGDDDNEQDGDDEPDEDEQAGDVAEAAQAEPEATPAEPEAEPDEEDDLTVEEEVRELLEEAGVDEHSDGDRA
ncbi:primosomal protein [Microbacterium sp. B2969]|uniref:Primosomal protein n=1 Tax=Microbacterium alkaliflavum TaxID=3248839 RepID=A0ABW7QDT7_9MICO